MDKQYSFKKLGDGTKEVTTAGTAVQLSATSVKCREVTITSEIENTDTIVVGGSTVDATAGVRRGVPIEPGQSVTIRVTDLNMLYLDALVSGESISFIYFDN